MVECIWKEIENRGYSVGNDISKGGAGQATTKNYIRYISRIKKIKSY